MIVISFTMPSHSNSIILYYYHSRLLRSADVFIECATWAQHISFESVGKEALAGSPHKDTEGNGATRWQASRRRHKETNRKE